MTEQAPVRKHDRIAATLGHEITAGVHLPGTRLPGEQALAARFRVSRNTLRAALAVLTEQGLIETRAGQGSFVTFGRGSFVTFDRRPLDDTFGWSRALSAPAGPVTATVLRLELVTDAAKAAEFGVEGDQLIAVDRVRRLTSGRPLSYERSLVPALGSLRELPARGLLGGSLTASLRAAGLVAVQGEEWVDVVSLAASDAAVLQSPPGTSFLHSQRTTLDPVGRFVEHVDSLLDPDHFQLHLRFQGLPA